MTYRTDWIQVSDQRNAEHLLDVTHGFHDAVVTSATWKGAEFVDQRFYMELLGYGDLYLRISSQFRDVEPIELKFLQVHSYQYDYDMDFEGLILVEAATVTAEFLAWTVKAEALEYRIAHEPDRRMALRI